MMVYKNRAVEESKGYKRGIKEKKFRKVSIEC
jgi:hypothetical protein